jgi:peptidoglycan/LPS O-acetylase OafA/YrhL
MNAAQRFAHIDALRGLAALIVVWLHVSEVFITLPGVKAQGTLLFDVAQQLNFGRLGVLIFFAISGFVIPSSLRGDKLSGLKKFVIRRFFRLFPAFWFSILLSLPTVWWLWGREMSLSLVLANFTMLPVVFGSEQVLGLYWTLETELAFYTLCVCLFVGNALHKPLDLFLTASLGIVIFLAFVVQLFPRPGVSQWILMPLHLAVMFWGAMIRQVYENKSLFVAIKNFRLPVWLLVGLLEVVFLTYALASWINYSQTGNLRSLHEATAYPLATLGFLLMVFVLPITHRAIVWLGTISYSLYLLHPTVFYPLRWWAEKWPPAVFAHYHVSVYLLICLPLSILLAWLGYTFVEAPAIALGRKYSAS